jgi:DUF971 family protein
MRILNFEVIGGELAIRWAEGGETFVELERLRRHCPCAGCKGEMDVMGNLYKGPESRLTPDSFRLKGIQRVGGYALQPIWADGHASGLFSFEYLYSLGQACGRDD